MSFLRLAVLAPRRALQVRHSFQYPLRQYSIFQDFSKKLKGEIDNNPELKESIKEFKEKAEGLKSRTKETAEHLYKHVDAARGQAETRAKQVSSVIKEKLSEASEQVRETVASVNVKKDAEQPAAPERKEAAAGRGSEQQEPFKASPESQAREREPETSGETKADSAGESHTQTQQQQQQQQQDTKSSKQAFRSGESFTGKVYQTLRMEKIAEVAKEGYNLLAEELTSTRRAKVKPAIKRSSVTDVVPLVKNTTGWRKHLEDLKEKASSHPVFRRLQTVKDHPVVQKSHEIVEEMRERIETSDSPVVHKIQNLNDSLFGETATAAANKEIRNRDPTFSLPDFVAEVQESVRPVLTAYLKGDLVALRKRCSKEVVERCRAEHRALKSQGMNIDNKILYISDVDVKETKLIGNEPVIIVSFQTQQNYCVKDDFGQIREGSKDDIRTVYYAWAMQYVPEEEMDPEDYTPRWQLREMQQLGVQAII